MLGGCLLVCSGHPAGVGPSEVTISSELPGAQSRGTPLPACPGAPRRALLDPNLSALLTWEGGRRPVAFTESSVQAGMLFLQGLLPTWLPRAWCRAVLEQTPAVQCWLLRLTGPQTLLLDTGGGQFGGRPRGQECISVGFGSLKNARLCIGSSGKS